MTSANDFLMGSGAPTFKFEVIGTTVAGTIAKDPAVMQQTDIATGAPKFWDDGRPREQLQIILATTLRDPADPHDDGHRAIYVKGEMAKAVRGAIRASGAKGIETGGHLSVTYSANGEPPKPGFSAPKFYTATYTPPAAAAANSFLANSGQAPAAPQAISQAAVPPAAPTAPAGAGAFTPEQLAAIQALPPEQRRSLGLM
jgi:hypothetical protein